MLVEILKNKIQKAVVYIEEILWQMKMERLMNACRDTGGESSPYLDNLQKHIETDPRKR